MAFARAQSEEAKLRDRPAVGRPGVTGAVALVRVERPDVATVRLERLVAVEVRVVGRSPRGVGVARMSILRGLWWVGWLCDAVPLFKGLFYRVYKSISCIDFWLWIWLWVGRVISTITSCVRALNALWERDKGIHSENRNIYYMSATQYTCLLLLTIKLLRT